MRLRPRIHRPRNLLTPRGVGTIGVAFALLGYLTAPSSSPRHAVLVWNASASAPIGLYRVTHTSKLSRGDLVLAALRPSLAAFAARRGYLPQGVPLVKRIAAEEADVVCSRGQALFINARLVAHRLSADSKGRPLPHWSGCQTLRAGEVFLLMNNVPASFDGRYFGPTTIGQIAGTLRPLWTR